MTDTQHEAGIEAALSEAQRLAAMPPAQIEELPHEPDESAELFVVRRVIAAYDAARSGDRESALDAGVHHGDDIADLWRPEVLGRAARSGEAEGDEATVERIAAALWAKATEQEIERTGTDFNVAHIHYEDAEEWRKVWVRGQAQAVLDALQEGGERGDEGYSNAGVTAAATRVSAKLHWIKDEQRAREIVFAVLDAYRLNSRHPHQDVEPTDEQIKRGKQAIALASGAQLATARQVSELVLRAALAPSPDDRGGEDS